MDVKQVEATPGQVSDENEDNVIYITAVQCVRSRADLLPVFRRQPNEKLVTKIEKSDFAVEKAKKAQVQELIQYSQNVTPKYKKYHA